MQIKAGDIVTFETFSKPKTQITGKVVKVFIAKDDNKEYCTVKHENKIYRKQTSKCTINESN